MARPRVALVIPTLNEEAAIGGVLAGLQERHGRVRQAGSRGELPLGQARPPPERLQPR